MFLRKTKDKYVLSDLLGQIVIISRSKRIALKYGEKWKQKNPAIKRGFQGEETRNRKPLIQKKLNLQ